MAADQSEASTSITIVNDILNEGAETFRVELRPNSAVGLGDPSELTVTIPANDPITYSLSPPSGVTEVMEGGTAEFNIGFGGVEIASPVTLTYSISGSVEEADYTDPGRTGPRSGSITIPAGSTRGTIAIRIDGDGMQEGAETLIVTLAGGRGSATVTIPANAANVRDFVTSGDFTALTEGSGARTYSVSFRPVSDPNEADLPSTTTVRWRLVGAGDNPIETADFQVASGTLTFAAGARSTMTFTATVTDDSLNEGAESYRVSLNIESGDSAGSAGVDSPVGTVADNAADTITVTFTAGTVTTINEGASATQTLALSGGTPTADNVVVPLLVTPAAMQGEVEITNRVGLRILRVPGDVTVTGGETGLYGFAVFTAPPGGQYATNATFRVTAFDDNLLEDAEMVSVTIGDPAATAYSSVPGVGSAGTVARAAGTPPTYAATIPANDPITVAVNPVSGQRLGVGEDSDLGFTVTFSDNQPTADIGIRMTIQGVGTTPTANADFGVAESDWTTSGMTVTTQTTITLASITLGQRIPLPTLRVLADMVDEEVETFQLTVVPSGGAPAPTPAIARFSPPEVVTTSRILRIDTQPPSLENVGYASPRPNDPTRLVWLRGGESDPSLAILLPANAAAPAGAGEQTGAMLDGFSVVVMSRPTETRTVSVGARYTSPNVIVLTLPESAALTTDDMGVFARYEYPGSGLGIFDRSLDNNLRPMDDPDRNQLIAPPLITLTAFLETADSDGDGIPDAAEARLGGDPLIRGPGSEYEGAEPPQVSVETGVRYFAYSGIREYSRSIADLRSHLGLNTTDTASATAYYLRGPNCAGQFPANAEEGGCQRVDFLNMQAGMDHKIGWVVRYNDQSYWATDLSKGSNLPEQTVYRVPEINMQSQRLFFTSGQDPDTVDVVAEHDGSARTSGPMLTLSTIPDGSSVTKSVNRARFMFSVPKADITSVSLTYSITSTSLSGMVRSGDGQRLGRAMLYIPDPSSPTAARPTGKNYYSLGLALQTKVVVLSRGGIPPTLGVPTLAVLEGGSRTTRTVAVRGLLHVLTIETVGVQDSPPPSVNFGDITTSDGVLMVRFTPTTTADTVSLSVTAYGIGASSVTAMYEWQVVNPESALAMATADHAGDDDGDGIPNREDSYRDLNQLPVLNGDVHIFSVVRRHKLRISPSFAEGGPLYVDYDMSEEGMEGSRRYVDYSFEAYGVDYDADPAGRITGGRVGIIVPLPLLSGTVEVLKGGKMFASKDGANEYGFGSSRRGVGCIRDSLDGTASPYRERADDGTYNLRREWSSGMDCLVVWLVDGGEYDEDGVPTPNTIVHDPIRVLYGRTGSRSGGSFGLSGIALLMLVMAATLLRRRRRARQ